MRVLALYDALHLLQLLHQVRLVVQPARRIGDQHIDAARAGRLHGVENDGRGIRAALLSDDGNIVAFGPGGELLDRSGAKRVAGREHHRLAIRL